VNHTRAHLTRAVLEGVAFGLRDSLELMRDAGIAPPTEIRATGGGIKSALWRRILADVLEASIVTTSTAEGAAQGAAILAAVGAGWFPTVEEACDALVRIGEATGTSEPSAYADAYARYRELYPALSPTFHSLGSGM
jgi:xylulokinase